MTHAAIQIAGLAYNDVFSRDFAAETANLTRASILQQAGISLGQTNVSTSGEQGAGSEGSRHGARSGRGTETSADTSEGASPNTWLRQHDGMVDTFV